MACLCGIEQPCAECRLCAERKNGNKTTDQEKEIGRVIKYIRSCRRAGVDTTITIDKNKNHFILNALEEVLQYRSIGTVEEFQYAMEKQTPKNPITHKTQTR